MARPFTPLAFANEFIAKAPDRGVVHMKLQKLVYLCYGWWLVAHDEAIINEAPQVWKHGPVFRSLYNVLASQGHSRIRVMQSRFFTATPDRIDDDDYETGRLIDWVWQKYQQYDQFDLSDMTHQPGSPWYQTAERFDFKVPYDTEIPDYVIQSHFRGIAIERGFYA